MLMTEQKPEGFAERRERQRQEKEAAKARAKSRREQMLAIYSDGIMPVSERLLCLERIMTHYVAEARCLQVEGVSEGQAAALDNLEKTVRCFNNMAPMLKKADRDLEMVPVVEEDRDMVKARLQELH